MPPSFTQTPFSEPPVAELPFPSPPPVVLFDLDGTLVHSVPDLTAAANACLAEDGRRSLSETEIAHMVGKGIRALVERIYAATGNPATSPDDVDSLAQRFNAHYMKAPAALTRPFPEVEETLTLLARAACPMGVVTNKPIAPTRRILDQLGLSRFFKTVLGGGSVSNLKPHPEPVVKALEELDAANRRAVFVGDSVNDVEAAHSAGLPCIILSYGYHQGPAEELGADVVVDRFGAIPNAVAQALATAASRKPLT